MATQITIKRNNKISEMECANKLEFIANNLSDIEIARLYELAQSKEAREALKNKWAMIQSFLT